MGRGCCAHCGQLGVVGLLIDIEICAMDLLARQAVVLAAVEELGLLERVPKHLWMLRQVVP
jgi:hypothetical protein